MRKLASVVEIATCMPIPDTDRLSVATMVGKGWRVVTGRDEFQPGELAVYVEIDAYLPADDERYAFLRERCLKKFVSKSGQVLREGIRIKTCKLRGVVSQGLLLKLDQFCGKEIQCVTRKATPADVRDENGNPLPPEEFADLAREGLEVTDMTCNGQPVADGFDLTEALHVEHYDEVKEQLRPATGGNPVSADAYGKFPSDYVPKTDEERCIKAGTLISTDKGLIKIENLEGMENAIRALSVSDSGNVEYSKITAFTKSSACDGWLKITLEDGSVLECTENHKIFSPSNGAYVNASELTENDTLCIGG